MTTGHRRECKQTRSTERENWEGPQEPPTTRSQVHQAKEPPPIRTRCIPRSRKKGKRYVLQDGGPVGNKRHHLHRSNRKIPYQGNMWKQIYHDHGGNWQQCRLGASNKEHNWQGTKTRLPVFTEATQASRNRRQKARSWQWVLWQNERTHQVWVQARAHTTLMPQKKSGQKWNQTFQKPFPVNPVRCRWGFPNMSLG